jgi:hypothetical protein
MIMTERELGECVKGTAEFSRVSSREAGLGYINVPNMEQWRFKAVLYLLPLLPHLQVPQQGYQHNRTANRRIQAATTTR